MPECVTSSIKLYADDAKLYRAITTLADADQLQVDLSSLQRWSQDWLLKFHPQKCTLLRLGLKSLPRATYFMYHGDEPIVLSWVDCEKDLGVKVDGRLTFQDEICSRVKKAYSIVGIIRLSLPT